MSRPGKDIKAWAKCRSPFGRRAWIWTYPMKARLWRMLLGLQVWYEWDPRSRFSPMELTPNGQNPVHWIWVWPIWWLMSIWRSWACSTTFSNELRPGTQSLFKLTWYLLATQRAPSARSLRFLPSFFLPLFVLFIYLFFFSFNTWLHTFLQSQRNFRRKSPVLKKNLEKDSGRIFWR